MAKEKFLSSALRDGGQLRGVDILNDPAVNIIEAGDIVRFVLLDESLEEGFLKFSWFLKGFGLSNHVRRKSPREGSFCSIGFKNKVQEVIERIDAILVACPFCVDYDYNPNFPNLDFESMKVFFGQGFSRTNVLTAISPFYYWVGYRRFFRSRSR